jgi:hypothetical protein
VSVEFQSFCREKVAWPVYELVMGFLRAIVGFLRFDLPANCQEKFSTASLVKTTMAILTKPFSFLLKDVSVQLSFENLN